MALTHESTTAAARRKAQRARQLVRAAEDDLVAANESLKAAIPRRDVAAIAEAAQRTVAAEEEVHEAAEELHAVEELLDSGAGPASQAQRNVSGEGTRSLLPLLRRGGRD